MIDPSAWGYEQGSPANENELVKEYTSEELYDRYASENKIPEVIENYINDLEKQIKLLTKRQWKLNLQKESGKQT